MTYAKKPTRSWRYNKSMFIGNNPLNFIKEVVHIFIFCNYSVAAQFENFPCSLVL
jgi:hypothetical protein